MHFIKNVLKIVVINFFKVMQFFKVVFLRLLKGVLLQVLYTSSVLSVVLCFHSLNEVLIVTKKHLG